MEMMGEKGSAVIVERKRYDLWSKESKETSLTNLIYLYVSERFDDKVFSEVEPFSPLRKKGETFIYFT